MDTKESCGRRRLVYVAATDLTLLKKKGVEDLLSGRTLAGYFNEVHTVHPLATVTRSVHVGPGHVVHEVGYDWIRLGRRFRVVRHALAPIYFLRAAKQVRSLLAPIESTVLRATDPYWSGLVVWLATRHRDVPWAVSVHADWDALHRLDPKHGAPRILGSRRLARILGRFIMRQADLVICISDFLAEVVVGQGIEPAKVRILRQLLDLSEESDQSPISGWRGKTVTFVGRLSPDNHATDLVQLAKLLGQAPGIKIEIFGDGPLAESLMKAIQRNDGPTAQVSFNGFVSRSEAVEACRRSDVVIVLTGGYSLIEAAATGAAIVAYDHEWHAELIVNEESGILVPLGDVEALAAGVVRLIKDPALARKLGSAARLAALKQHDERSVTVEHQAIYEELASMRSQ